MCKLQQKQQSRVISRKSVSELADPDKLCLLIIGDEVYDCTRWQSVHPGGHLTVRAMCGKDATDSFAQMHPQWVMDRMGSKFLYATLDDGSAGNDDDAQPREEKEEEKKEDGTATSASANDEASIHSSNEVDDGATLEYRSLTKRLEEAGLFETDLSFYYKKGIMYSALFLLMLSGVLLSDDIRVHFASGILLGFFWQQLAFIGHDLGHNSVTRDRNMDGYLGLIVGNFLSGISIGWWKRSHNVHHVVPNSCDYDPDIQHLPVFAIDPVLVTTRMFSTYSRIWMPSGGPAHVLVKYQEYLYYPVMAFARFNLYVQSWNHALRLSFFHSAGDLIWKQNLQIASLAGFWTWLILLTMSLPTWASRLAFFIPAHVFAGILHVQITLSHFPMETYTGVGYDDSSNGFLRTQLATTMDIDCPRSMDWFHGGLQFQVVHHLWPRLPRHNLRYVMENILVPFCKEHQLGYNHANFLEANKMVLTTLRETAKSTKQFSELFRESLNLMG